MSTMTNNQPAGEPSLTDHNYDGIQEFDNPTPGWWWAIFAATMLFAPVYYLIYNLDPGATTVIDEWKQERNAAYTKMFAGVGDLQADNASFFKLMGDPKWMNMAESMFRGNCVSCHAANGEGNIGPNLTDDSFKNIKVMTDIFKVISNGANAGAMPAQSGRYTKNEMVLLSAYVASLRGKNLPGRAAEGEKIAPWPTAPSSTPTSNDKGAGK